MSIENTDPLYRQLVTEEEVEALRQMEKDRKRNKEHRYHRRDEPPFHGRPEEAYCEPAPEFPDPSHGTLMKNLFKFLVPFDDPWRLAIGFSVLFLLLNTAASRGWFTIIGLSAQASAASVTEIRAAQIEEQLFVTIKAHCMAMTQEGKGFYARHKVELLNAYETVTGRKYPIEPTCRDLGVRESLVGEP